MNTLTAHPDASLVTWAARRTIAQHAEPPADSRATGRCAHCPPDDGPVCATLTAAIHYLRAAAGITR